MRTAFLLWLLLAWGCSRSGARADDDFPVDVPAPTYRDGPVVLFDEAHHNIHTMRGTYRPFARLLRNDGYRLERNRDPLYAARLGAADVLVIANALGANEVNDDGAFTAAECDAIADWVRAGGALLLVVDHFPTGDAAQELARRFGVDLSRGETHDSASYERELDPSNVVYTRERGLTDHPIDRGLGKVMTFTGSSLGVPPGAQALLALSDDAVDLTPAPVVERDGNDVRVHVGYDGGTPARGRAQALALPFGAGRVVILAEAAMATAQLSAYDGSRFGMNYPGTDNKQFVLNVLHWLSGALDADPAQGPRGGRER